MWWLLRKTFLQLTVAMQCTYHTQNVIVAIYIVFWAVSSVNINSGYLHPYVMVTKENLLDSNRCYAMYSLHWHYLWKCSVWCDGQSVLSFILLSPSERFSHWLPKLLGFTFQTAKRTIMLKLSQNTLYRLATGIWRDITSGDF